MKRRFVIALSVLVVALVAAAFSIGRASASTGCFNDTNGNWAETYICWMKDNGITTGTGGGNYSPNNNVTRAEMAVFMARLADVPPSTGDIYINAGSSGWVAENGLGTVSHSANASRLFTNSGSDVYYMISPSLPSGLYNKETVIKGVKLCYAATFSAAMTGVVLSQYAGDGTLVNGVSDYTPRSDKACRVYTITNPSYFWGGDQVSLEVIFHSPSAGVSYWVDIYSATFILGPSPYAAHALNPPFSDGQRPAINDTETHP
jgi:hypothetical protein